MNSPARIPFAVLIPISGGSDPEVMEIEDLHEVYGDWPEIDTPCESPLSRSGQCVFNAVSLQPNQCLYCGKMTG